MFQLKSYHYYFVKLDDLVSALFLEDIFEFCALWKKLLSRKPIEKAFLVRQGVYLKYAVNRFWNATVSETNIQIYFFLHFFFVKSRMLATSLPYLISNLFLLIFKFETEEPTTLEKLVNFQTVPKRSFTVNKNWIRWIRIGSPSLILLLRQAAPGCLCEPWEEWKCHRIIVVRYSKYIWKHFIIELGL